MQQIESEIAHVLFADVVAYSLLSLEAQAEVASRFKGLARATAEEFACTLLVDAGDGVALIFFGGGPAAASCTLCLGQRLAEAGIGARIGLHCGPLTRTLDINGRPNAIGPAVNIAERVMSCADPGHVLLSGAAAEMAGPDADLAPFLYDLGEHEVKHGVRIRLVNLVTDRAGRADIPGRLREKGRKSNLTAPERPFVGRATELENLRQRLEDGQERLLTLTGPGGIGKTRVALQVAETCAPNYADGAWVVDCDALQSGDDLVAQIANVLDVSLGTEPLTSLRTALADKQILLVIDCFERLISHAKVLEDLLKHARELQIIATSRTLLGLPRESEIVLAPLSLKREGGSHSDAVELFVGAAKSIDPRFRITRQNHEKVEAIITAVEGIPLAIILAAGRLRHLSLHELCEQLGHRRLDILQRRVASDDRHANLRRVVDDSFCLLRDELKELLISLSVFRGFHLRDAEAVLDRTPNLLEGISELRENSLLAAQVVDDQMRFRCLDVVAEYLEGASDPYKLEPLRRRHAEHFASRAVWVRELYEDGRWREANAAVGAEFGNYRRAIEVAVASKDPTLIRPLAASLCRILMEGGYRADFDKLASASLELAEEENDLPLLIETTGLIGCVYSRDQDFEGATKQWLRRALYCKRVGDAEKEADTWLDLAAMALAHGNREQVDEYLDRFTTLEPSLSQGLVLASGYVARARAAAEMGRREEARKVVLQAKELADALPLRMHSFFILSSLAEVYNDLGEALLSEEICISGIRETLMARHYSNTGFLLFRLFVSLEIQGRISEAASALAIAEMIPKSVAQTLRERLKVVRAEFVKKYGLQLLLNCENKRNRLDWQGEALGLVESLGETKVAGERSPG